MPERHTRIGRYNILSEIGRGSSARVFLGVDPFTDRKVAVKLSHLDAHAPRSEARRLEKLFYNEASLAGKLNHPNIVALYDAQVDGTQRYLVMEYVPGGNLRRHCDVSRLLPERQVARIVFELCRALDYAAQAGVIHRDIKPANVLVAPGGRVKIGDFGTACVMHSPGTQLDGFLGSPAYMAPERVKEQPATEQSDIYSLGVVMYELLSGRLPYQASSSVAMIDKVLNEDPVPLASVRPSLPESLVEIVTRAIARRPADRFAGWFEMANALAMIFPRLDRVADTGDARVRFGRLRSLAFFREFRDEEVWEVLRGAKWEVRAEGDNLLPEDEVGAVFSVIVSGRAKVSRGDRPLNVLGEGECFGEIACLSAEARRQHATVTALSPIEVLKVRASVLERLSDSCQLRFNRAFLRSLIERLTWTSAALAQS